MRADDGLPGQVCSQCIQQVNSSYNFKQRCEDTDTILRKMYIQMQVDFPCSTIDKRSVGTIYKYLKKKPSQS